MFIREAGEAFTSQQERMEWLIKNYDIYDYASLTMIPLHLMNIFIQVGEIYNIPWWFIAAIAMTESSFNPQAENSSSGAYGLMQVMPSNWQFYAPQLGFDPIASRDDPYAQVLVGTYLLNSYIGGGSNIDWDGDWQSATLPGLTFYSGFRTDGVIDDAAIERCRKHYAEPKVWKYAERFVNTRTVWPVPGHTTITSPFSHARKHPVYGTIRPHYGIDISAPMGADIVSVSGGVVTFAGWENPGNKKQGYGKYIIIEDGVHAYYYAHLNNTASGMRVNVGDAVSPGVIIGEIGSTGTSTGPHLHFGVYDVRRGAWIDPMTILTSI
jgi:hypothetical protein